MRFAFSDEQDQLRRALRRALDDAGGVAAARRAMASEVGHDAALWRVLGRDLGLAGLLAPEALGGAGLGWVEVVAVMEELGAVVAAVPFFATVALAGAALQVAADDAQRRALWPTLARGDATATVAYLAPGADPGADVVGAAARAVDGGHLLSGTLRAVVDGATADLVLVAATDAAGDVALYAVAGDAAGLTRRRVSTMDQTRALAELTLDDVRVAATARLAAGGRDVVARVLDLARIALAAEQLGGAQRCLDLAVDYAKVRHQFGRPIGSFQAVQHACADMFVAVESARSAAYHAGWAADQDLPALAEVAAATSAFCGDAFFRVAGDTIQVHGGIGFTWEHDAHLYFKRARASRALLGAPASQRERVAHHLGLGVEATATAMATAPGT